LKPLIIPIFIPHNGCPHRCIFCDQERITAQPGRGITRDHVKDILDQAVRSNTYDRRRAPEAAFYGGTFTGLSVDQMKALLEPVQPFIEQGLIQSIRVSTRPDFIDEDRLDLLKSFHVTTVELGIQSMDDRVLTLARRGHSAADVKRAVHLLKKQGLRVGAQLMPGLPGDSRETFQATIQEVISLHPDMARLYPALVIAGTGLERMLNRGAYRPLTVDEAVNRCANAAIRLERSGIPVIRIGLMSSPSLLEPGRIAAGPWHPAFGFLVRSAMLHRAMGPALPAYGTVKQFMIFAPGPDIPLVRGHRNEGIRRIETKTGARVTEIAVDNTLSRGSIRIEAR